MTITVPPEECPSMEILRAQIDLLDTDIVSLLAKRATYIDRAVDLKQIEGLPAHIPQRVEEVLGHARSRAVQAGLDPDLVETLWRALINWSIDREARVIRRN
ncbi:MAG: chorismate mutase [Pseudomonadota bacterium]